MANPLDLLKDMAAKFAGIEAALAKVTVAEERVKSLEEQLASNAKNGIKLVEELEAERKAHAETKSTLEKAQGEVASRDTEISTLKVSVETEKGRAAGVIASQGVPADLLPTQSADSGSTATHSVQAQVDQLRRKISASTDPKEKFTLSQQIKDLLGKAKH
jgi:hypothetical protein